MPLSEEEELEMLELENENALLLQGSQNQAQPKERGSFIGGLLGRDVESGATLGNILEETGRYTPQVLGAIAGSPAGPLGSVAGAAAGESVRGAAQQIAAQYGYSPQLSVRDVYMNPVMAAAGEAGGAAVMRGAGIAAKPFLPGARKVGAQTIRVLSGVPEREAAAVLKDPAILSRARPVSEAAEQYISGTGGASSGTTEARRALTGKTYLSAENAVNQFDDIAPALGAANDTEVLALRQSLMDTIADTPMKQSRLRKLLADRIEILDNMLEGRLPDWSGAKKAFREAKVAEEFQSWLPLNKNLSPNVLRTTAAIAAAGKGLVENRPFLALGLPMISPRAWGTGIRTAYQASRAAPRAAGIGGTESLRKYYGIR